MFLHEYCLPLPLTVLRVTEMGSGYTVFTQVISETGDVGDLNCIPLYCFKL